MKAMACFVRGARSCWLGSASMLLGVAMTAGMADTVTNRFGFSGKEIFPIDYQISQLRNADFDGDGLQDLVVVNNARSKITILYNQTGRTGTVEKLEARSKRELNELPPGARFKIESIASEKRISSLAVADLNGDGRPDLAFFGEPRELVVLLNEGKHAWGAPKRWPFEDGLLNPNALVAGDLTGEGRPGILLLGESCIYWLAQEADHTLAEPRKIPYSGSLQALQVLDIEGDGRDDLLLVNWENANPFRFRLQTASGQLGPEIYFPLPPIRSYFADDLDGDHKAEVVTIAQKSGRAQVASFARKGAERLAGDWRQGQFELLPLTKTGKAKRGLLWTDINADGRPDLLVSEPESGQLTVYLQQSNGQLATPKTFPTLSGVSDLAAGDWDQTGQPTLFLLSSEERQVGTSRWAASGGVSFPAILSIEGRPLAFALAPLESGAKPSLVVLVDQDGRREIQIHSATGDVRHQKLNENYKATPTALAIHDLNQDGLQDLVILNQYDKMKLLIHVAGKDFDEQDIVPPGGSTEEPWLSSADVDGDGKPELLLAQRNFLRAVVARSEVRGGTNRPTWSFVVKEQINGAASNSRIVSAAALHNGTNRFDSLFLLDAERKALTLCDRTSAGAWQVTRNLSLPVSEFRAIQPLALGANQANCITFFGLNSVAWQRLEGEVWDLNELDGYESPIRDSYLNDVVTGDLNQDGRKDLVFLETAKSYIDVVTFEPPHELVPANRWQVFEERTFRSRRAEAPEPREALIADFNGDGKNDLVVLVHDRLILYPQE